MFGLYQLIKTGHVLTPTDYYQKYKEKLIIEYPTYKQAEEHYNTIPSEDRSNLLVCVRGYIAYSEPLLIIGISIGAIVCLLSIWGCILTSGD